MCRSVNPKQGCESDSHIYRLDAVAIGSGLEGQAIERQRHVGVVGIGRGVICSLGRADGVDIWNSHHVPASFRRITVQVFASKGSGGSLSVGELRLGVVVAEASLLQGFPYGGFGVEIG